jgi:hypothetical protein
LDSSYERFWSPFPEKHAPQTKYKEIYFLDYADSIEAHKKEVLGLLGQSEGCSVISVRFFDWKKREPTNGVDTDGFQLFDDPGLQSVLRLSDDIKPLAKYSVNSKEIPASEELSSWFVTEAHPSYA